MSPSKTKRCGHAGCNHYEGVHRPSKGVMPANCAQCTGRRALHIFDGTDPRNTAVPA